MTELSESDIAEIWEDELQPEVFQGARPSKEPILVLLGGQPGAGKTHAQRRVQQMYGESDLVKIIGDDYRSAHPDYLHTLNTDPLRMPDVTAAAAGKWVELAIDHALNQRYGVVVEGTWRNPDVPLATLRKALDAGFRVHAVILGVAQEHSRLQCMMRYYFDLDRGKPARWTPPTAHDVSYERCPGTFELLTTTPGVDRTAMLTREGLVAYSKWLSGTRDGQGARRSVETERERIWSRIEASEWLGFLDRARRFRELTSTDREAERAWDRLETLDRVRVVSMASDTS